MTAADRERVARLVAQRSTVELDTVMRELHARHHANPRAHVATHRAWMTVHRSRGDYGKLLVHAFAAFIVAGPASLVQRYTGLVVPAFKQRD